MIQHLWSCKAPGAENARQLELSKDGISPMVDLSAEAGSHEDISAAAGLHMEVMEISSGSDDNDDLPPPRKIPRYLQLHPYSEPVFMGWYE